MEEEEGGEGYSKRVRKGIELTIGYSFMNFV